MAKKKSKPFLAFLYDLSYSYPQISKNLAVFIDFWVTFTRPKDARLPKEAPRPPSHLDIFLSHVSYVVLNGLLISGAVCLSFSIPFKLEYAIGFGILRFMANDVLQQLFWRPLVRVAGSIKLR